MRQELPSDTSFMQFPDLNVSSNSTPSYEESSLTALRADEGGELVQNGELCGRSVTSTHERGPQAHYTKLEHSLAVWRKVQERLGGNIAQSLSTCDDLSQARSRSQRATLHTHSDGVPEAMAALEATAHQLAEAAEKRARQVEQAALECASSWSQAKLPAESLRGEIPLNHEISFDACPTAHHSQVTALQHALREQQYAFRTALLAQEETAKQKAMTHTLHAIEAEKGVLEEELCAAVRRGAEQERALQAAEASAAEKSSACSLMQHQHLQLSAEIEVLKEKIREEAEARTAAEARAKETAMTALSAFAEEARESEELRRQMATLDSTLDEVRTYKIVQDHALAARSSWHPSDWHLPSRDSAARVQGSSAALAHGSHGSSHQAAAAATSVNHHIGPQQDHGVHHYHKTRDHPALSIDPIVRRAQRERTMWEQQQHGGPANRSVPQRAAPTSFAGFPHPAAHDSGAKFHDQDSLHTGRRTPPFSLANSELGRMHVEGSQYAKPQYEEERSLADNTWTRIAQRALAQHRNAASSASALSHPAAPEDGLARWQGGQGSSGRHVSNHTHHHYHLPYVPPAVEAAMTRNLEARGQESVLLEHLRTQPEEDATRSRRSTPSPLRMEPQPPAQVNHMHRRDFQEGGGSTVDHGPQRRGYTGPPPLPLSHNDNSRQGSPLRRRRPPPRIPAEMEDEGSSTSKLAAWGVHDASNATSAGPSSSTGGWRPQEVQPHASREHAGDAGFLSAFKSKLHGIEEALMQSLDDSMEQIQSFSNMPHSMYSGDPQRMPAQSTVGVSPVSESIHQIAQHLQRYSGSRGDRESAKIPGKKGKRAATFAPGTKGGGGAPGVWQPTGPFVNGADSRRPASRSSCRRSRG